MLTKIDSKKTIQTRDEHSRSIEDAERYRALETLKELGLLVPVSEVETYHGRLGSKSAEDVWRVDPSFSNGSNDSGNNNANQRATLYTGGQELALDFAVARARDSATQILRSECRKIAEEYTLEQKTEWLNRLNRDSNERWNELDETLRKHYPKGPSVYTMDSLNEEFIIWQEAKRIENGISTEEEDSLTKHATQDFNNEVHEISVANPDATVIDINFDSNALDTESKARYFQALAALQISITEGSPVAFEHSEDVRLFAGSAQRANKFYLYKEDVEAIVAETGMDADVAIQLCGSHNSSAIASMKPAYLVLKLILSRENIVFDSQDSGGQKRELPINLEYVERYLRLAHIVGVKQKVESKTLNRSISSVSFFDLEKTKTRETLETERNDLLQKFGGAAAKFSQLMPVEAMPGNKLMAQLSDAHVKPERLVEAAKLIEGFDQLFDADTGNWEGFTLAEHTETVLRNFDENFADKLPTELLAPMRLAILSHDLGKPIAVAKNETRYQKKHNAVKADEFLTKVGVDERLKGIILAVIGEGSDLAFKIDIKGVGELAETEMRNFARETLEKFNDNGDDIENQIDGFIEMCKMLQICDGGAYTSMAVTRSARGVGRYRNAPSFNRSFAEPVGLGKRGLRLKRAGDKPAPRDLTPKSKQNS